LGLFVSSFGKKEKKETPLGVLLNTPSPSIIILPYSFGIWEKKREGKEGESTGHCAECLDPFVDPALFPISSIVKRKEGRGNAANFHVSLQLLVQCRNLSERGGRGGEKGRKDAEERREREVFIGPPLAGPPASLSFSFYFDSSCFSLAYLLQRIEQEKKARGH